MQEPFLTAELEDEAMRERQDSRPDWHARALRALASQLGPACDYYFPLLGAASKIEMYERGNIYADAVRKEG